MLTRASITSEDRHHATDHADGRAFDARLEREGVPPLARRRVTTLQLNIGLRCNLACHHCHVESGPKRTEQLDRRGCERILELLERNPEVRTLDITGGAPELHPHFRDLVRGARALGRRVIDRCNLTVLFEPGQEDTDAFLAEQSVEIVASLPCYSLENVEQQRGRGVFDGSIRALQRLNALGYGQAEGQAEDRTEDRAEGRSEGRAERVAGRVEGGAASDEGGDGGSALKLDLVYNPVGAFLPPDQGALEAEYRARLKDEFGIVFDRLLTITNMPIKRFAHSLHREGRYEAYMRLLVDHFDAANADHVMCRDLVSVAHDGTLYDCDFNQALDLPLPGPRTTIFDVDDLGTLEGRRIATGDHCFGCLSGAGSSCGGALR